MLAPSVSAQTPTQLPKRLPDVDADSHSIASKVSHLWDVAKGLGAKDGGMLPKYGGDNIDGLWEQVEMVMFKHELGEELQQQEKDDLLAMVKEISRLSSHELAQNVEEDDVDHDDTPEDKWRIDDVAKLLQNYTTRGRRGWGP
eukprot:6489252-Amphidinium_carterae.1